MNDEFFIKRTLRLAAKAQGMTSPNPMVGAVIVKNGEIISEDYHRQPGTPHAEALVIKKAGENARDATLYVNLEPCCHVEKRTPPCTEAIIDAGIIKVIIAINDPNPKVSGKGILELQKAGIFVKSGILKDEAERLNESYIKYITTGKPFVTLKIAMTLDGKIATPEGQSKWITGERARKIVHQMRSSVDAIVTAIGTVKADDPQLTARIKGGKDPKKIIIDPDLEISINAKIFQTAPETIIVTKESGIKSKETEIHRKKEILLEKGVKIITYNSDKMNLDRLMEKLGKMEISSVLIEGGSSLNAHALEDGIVDKVIFFIAPKIIGGKKSFSAVGGDTYRKLEEAHVVKKTKMKRIGEDFLIEGYIQNK